MSGPSTEPGSRVVLPGAAFAAHPVQPEGQPDLVRLGHRRVRARTPAFRLGAGACLVGWFLVTPGLLDAGSPPQDGVEQDGPGGRVGLAVDLVRVASTSWLYSP